MNRRSPRAGSIVGGTGLAVAGAGHRGDAGRQAVVGEPLPDLARGLGPRGEGLAELAQRLVEAEGAEVGSGGVAGHMFSPPLTETTVPVM